MPIEIFELVIKAKVNDAEEEDNPETQSSQNNQVRGNSQKEVAEEVLKIMKRKKER